MKPPPPEGAPAAPLPPEKLIDLDFLDARSKLLDLAAFLDRVDRSRKERAEAVPGDAEDFRVAALREAIGLLDEPGPGRVAKILNRLSDPTTEPIEKAGTKGAVGAWNPAPKR